MITRVLSLIKILFDIVRLRKGPDAIPRSFVLFYVVVAMWLAAGAVLFSIVEELDRTDFLVGIFTSAVGLASYTAIVVSFGKQSRLLQTMTAVIGCGALIEALFVASNLLLTPLIGREPTIIVGALTLLWSVPVEGHILSRAVDRHWYFGVLVAMAVFIFQYYLSVVINADQSLTS